ncbi:PA3371 family protein [Pseudomonas sp. EggHat1]|uniref:PA3371 family protein n=1 Tax=Pseudomonas sp. EggHat1 TaxID=2761624 RepID=UPI001866B592|nr:PA3371 family protein [Pseudomonas sp. EggHat1]
MSRSAILLLIMTLSSLAVLWLSPALDGGVALLLKGGCVVFGAGFLVALMAGRRIKFDPVLR